MNPSWKSNTNLRTHLDVVHVGEAVKELMKTYVNSPVHNDAERGIFRSHYLTQIMNVSKHVGDSLAKDTGVKIPLPTREIGSKPTDGEANDCQTAEVVPMRNATLGATHRHCYVRLMMARRV